MIRHAAGILILVAVLALAGCMAASQTGNFSADAAICHAGIYAAFYGNACNSGGAYRCTHAHADS